MIEARRVLSPDFFAGLDASSLVLSKVCLRDIGSLSSEWASAPPSSALQFPSVSQFEAHSLGGCTGNAFLQLLCCFPAVRSVKMYGCFPVDDYFLAHLSDRLPLSIEIVVSRSTQLRTALINSKGRSIKHLSLSMCPILSYVTAPNSLISCALNGSAVTDRVVEEITRVCSSLILLDVSHCQALNEPVIISSTLSILKADYCISVISMHVECPLLQSFSLSGCTAMVQLVVHSSSIISIDLTMLKPLKCIELRCEYLTVLKLCGCESLKYYGRYLTEDFKRISLDTIKASCPSISFGSGSCLAGSPLYDEYNYVNSINSASVR